MKVVFRFYTDDKSKKYDYTWGAFCDNELPYLCPSTHKYEERFDADEDGDGKEVITCRLFVRSSQDEIEAIKYKYCNRAEACGYRLGTLIK